MVNTIDKNGSTPLMCAVHNSRLDIVNILLHLGADVNAKNFEDETPLIIATKYSTREIVYKLLDAGAETK